MAERDAWARTTPYEIGIPGRDFAEENFAAIRREAEARGVDETDPGAFLLLGEVGRTLKEIQGEERGGEALHQFGAFLFHAYHFHQAGEPLLLVETEALREVLDDAGVTTPEAGNAPGVGGGETGPGEEGGDDGQADPGDAEGWGGELPAAAGYLQLPRHLVWSHPDPEGPAEDLDGVFWAHSTGGSLSLLAALGIRGDRPGLSVVPLPPVPLTDAPRWPRTPVRQEGEGPDFATTLPGGELDGLYSLVRAGELLKLVARVMAHLHANPAVLGAAERAPHPRDAAEVATGRMAGARPSLLPYRRIGSSRVG